MHCSRVTVTHTLHQYQKKHTNEKFGLTFDSVRNLFGLSILINSSAGVKTVICLNRKRFPALTVSVRMWILLWVEWNKPRSSFIILEIGWTTTYLFQAIQEIVTNGRTWSWNSQWIFIHFTVWQIAITV